MTEAGASGLAVSRVSVDGEETMRALGAQIAEVGEVGDVVFLRGPLGSGKSTLARGYIRHFLGDPGMVVTSPTYLLDNVYPDEGNSLLVDIPVHHMDLWRLRASYGAPHERSDALNLSEVFTTCVSLVEWPDRMNQTQFPASRLDVSISSFSGDLDTKRLAELRAHGPAWADRLNSIVDGFQRYLDDSEL